MKRIIRIMGLCALVALATTACKKEAQTTSNFKATLTQPTSDAKTGINNNLNLVWNANDQIKVFDNNGEEYIFTTTDDGTTTATFTGAELDASASYVAFYPAENASIDGNIIKLGINANQSYAPNSFAAGTYPMVAKSEAGNLAFTFTSDCGLLAIPVKGSGSIGSIELTGKADEDLAGQLQYTIGGDFNYYDSSSKKVTLNCGGVSLGTDPKVFYFVLPSSVLYSGFTAVLKDIMGNELGTLSTDKDNHIDGQTIRMMPAVTVGQPGMVINVETPQTSSATPNQCTLTGSVTYDPGVVLDEVGFYYGTASKGLNELPANLTNKVTLANVPASGASFSYTLTGLAENTAYQYCVYVKTGNQEIYGGVESFSTPEAHEYVDLGLPSGLLWATCNVGADNPEDYGDYFAWGETQTKSNYNWSTYQYCNGSSNTLTKYCNNASYGYNSFTDDLTTLQPGDDAATANWGSGWRMPTKEEWQELLNNTTNTWTQQGGVNGWLFTAANSNSLFLPAAGYRNGPSVNLVGDYGYYWSSSLITDSPNKTWYFGFNSGIANMYDGSRCYGRPVRAVLPAPQN